MRPKKPKEELRVPLNCLIAPATLTTIVATAKEDRCSQGVVVDRAVALLAFGAFGDAIERPRPQPIGLEGVRGFNVHPVAGRPSMSFKRAMRQKGDKTR